MSSFSPQTPIGSRSLHLYNLGNQHLNSQDYHQAISYYQQALTAGPPFPEALHNLAIATEKTGQIDMAVTYLDQATKLDPNQPIIPYNFGNLYFHQGAYKKAIPQFKIAIKLKPDFFQAHLNCGIAYFRLNQGDMAVRHFKQAVKANPHHVDGYNNLGTALSDQGNLPQAIEVFKQGVKLDPQNSPVLTNLVFALQKGCEWDEFDRYYPQLEKITQQELKANQKTGETPFFNLTHCADPKTNYQIAKAWSDHLPKIEPFIQKSKSKDRSSKFEVRSSESKIRLGYLSYDFRNHVNTHHFMNIFSSHDKSKFETYAYSYGPNDNSKYRNHIQNNATKFIDVTHESYVDTAKRIQADEIDILIDMNGHTEGSRLEILKYQPAPVQITYLGYSGTTGADFVDYLISDLTISPKSHAKYYSEKLAYLPHSLQPNSYPEIPLLDKEGLGVVDAPKRTNHRLPENAFIFASFNNSYKTDRTIFSTWLEILKKVDNSVLWLFKNNHLVEKNFTAIAKQTNIDPKRLVFAGRVNLDEHLERLQLADLGLDTTRYNGGATTSNALWAGIPVVTLLGTHFPSRTAASVIRATNLKQMVTKSLVEYKQLAIDLANNPKKLNLLKSKIKNQKSILPLFNTKQYTRDLEQLYLKMWQRYQEGKKSTTIEL